MKISVAMPTFNSASFVSDALDSLEKQINSNFELVVFDGGSTDGTLDILSEHPLKHRLFQKKDDGAYDALNSAFKACEGDIFCWLNSDDVYLRPDVLSKVEQIFEKNQDRSMIYGHSCVMERNGNIVKTLLSWQVDNESNLDGFNLFTGSMFFSNKLWSKFGGFSGRSKAAFEYELIDFAFRNGSPLYINEVFAGLRIHDETISHFAKDTMLRDIQAARGRTIRKAGVRRISQMAGMARSGVLGRALRNRYKDEHAGAHWRKIFEPHTNS